MFFDDHRRFLKTGTVFTNPDRLNLRHRAIFEQNHDVFSGARVLDIASHDGRWSLAALKAGAKHVTGIEARAEGVESARKTFAKYGEDPGSHTFLAGDIFETLANNDFDVDVVMCLGFLYHTYRHTELLHQIRSLHPTYVVVDSTVARGKGAVVRLHRDDPDKPGHAVLDPYAHGPRTLVGHPTPEAIRMMLDTYDFEVERETDWAALIAERPKAKDVKDYRNGKRVTMLARSRT